ncbi:HEAT repeat domain-containing protein [Stenotrophomonas rhizophila]|uniref:HEAT repeat domain-containing protein n=1 Tax=Stenotrophomonas rhizophila TaxID=216778 RepID=UPI001E44810C|nr:HEAT repeat domain-containing protein [Stenotrophomonas rhizophila]MCC7635858.1 HEAT repeat domain-containing protein [Stenotrophomonas rhizophila]MCC7662682.1 HEAT repeat domain-containing protein [Stenotrophomonas rhizophila]
MEGIENIRSDDIDDYKDWLYGLYNSGGLKRCISRWMRNFARGDGLAVKGGAGGENSAVVYEDEFVIVHFRCITATEQNESALGRVCNSPVASLMMPVLGVGVEYVKYAVCGMLNIEEFSRDAVLSEEASGVIRAGHILDVARGASCLWLNVPEGDVFAVQVSSRRSEKLIWTFDRYTGRALAVSSASIDATRTQIVCRTLASFDAVSQSPLLCQLARHSPFHFVRMEAIESLFYLNYPELMQLMAERAEIDPHAHVRRACERNVERAERIP